MANYKITQSGAQLQADLNKTEELANIKSVDSSFSINALNGQLEVASDHKLPTTSEWAAKQDNISGGSAINVSGSTVSVKNNLSNNMNITISSATPSTASNGDIWFKY